MDEKILIFDQDGNLQQTYRHELEDEGYRVYAAFDNEEALAHIHTNAIDIVVMEIVFSNGLGLDYLHNIANTDRSLKVVINSGFTEYKYDFHTWLANAFITKSDDLTELKSTIRRILQNIA
ncbi:MAG: response regulator [Calditrichaeota bacterium]|nr:MAG: response regulator [Calditrichota bacterium]